MSHFPNPKTIGWTPRPGRVLAVVLVLAALWLPGHADSLWVGAGILLGLTLADRRSLRDTVRIAHARNESRPLRDAALRDAAGRAPLPNVRLDRGRRNELTGELAEHAPKPWLGRKAVRRVRTLEKRRIRPAA